MKEEITKVLTMIQEGKIDADKGAELIGLINQKEEVKPKQSYLEKMLRIRINSNEGDTVNVNLPLRLIVATLTAVKGSLPSLMEKSKVDPKILEGVDLDLVLQAIEHEVVGDIIDITSADGDVVRIFVE